MRGIVLAGGTGSRLGSLTKSVNKHLLPVDDRPMIYWPLKVLQDNNITDITIVSSAQGVGQLATQLGGDYTYRVQNSPGGIPQAISCAGYSRDYEPVVVILGDNIFLPSPIIPRTPTIIQHARCYLKEVLPDKISEFGVATFAEAGYVSRIDEKPANPASNFAVTGMYIFSHDVFDKICLLPRSERGETEVTDLLNLYASINALDATIVLDFWGDAGTPDGLSTCSGAAKKYGKYQLSL